MKYSRATTKFWIKCIFFTLHHKFFLLREPSPHFTLCPCSSHSNRIFFFFLYFLFLLSRRKAGTVTLPRFISEMTSQSNSIEPDGIPERLSAAAEWGELGGAYRRLSSPSLSSVVLGTGYLVLSRIAISLSPFPPNPSHSAPVMHIITPCRKSLAPIAHQFSSTFGFQCARGDFPSFSASRPLSLPQSHSGSFL